MKAVLEVLEDGHGPLLLCFATKEDAERFKRFSNIYMSESGAGNGYGAYWCYFDSAISEVTEVIRLSKTELRRDLVEDMLSDILRARTAGSQNPPQIDLVFGQKDGAITFNFGELPPHQNPAVGDMMRVFSREATPEEEKIGEGRVLDDVGDELEVISVWDEGEDGKPKPGVVRKRVRKSVVMKIYDYMSEIHGRARG